ncbi:MAG: hypothetical protein H7831_09915 [Magnetococcus sp. WYHC-3]
MKREIKIIDKEKGIVQWTFPDERWYEVDGKFIPSTTWICGYYPKGVPFYKWLADKGWDEAEAIKSAAGDKGSKVHQAIDDLVSGKEIGLESKYLNKSTGEEEELTAEEYKCIMSFAKWFKDVNPVIVGHDILAHNEQEGYAGMVDFVCEIEGQTYIVDFKTSANIWPEYELQVSAYKHALNLDAKLAILQVGYNRNKNEYKFTEVEDKFDLFLSAKKIWANECEGIQPKQREYPLTIKL